MKFKTIVFGYCALAVLVLLVMIVMTFGAASKVARQLAPARESYAAAEQASEAANDVLRPLEEQQRLTRADLDPKETVELSAKVQAAQEAFQLAEAERVQAEATSIALQKQREKIMIRLVPLIALLLLHAFAATYFLPRRQATV